MSSWQKIGAVVSVLWLIGLHQKNSDCYPYAHEIFSYAAALPIRSITLAMECLVTTLSPTFS